MADWWVANPTGNGFWGSRPPPESVADWGVTTPMASTGRGVATPTGIGALLSFFFGGGCRLGGHDPDGVHGSWGVATPARVEIVPVTVFVVVVDAARGDAGGGRRVRVVDEDGHVEQQPHQRRHQDDAARVHADAAAQHSPAAAAAAVVLQTHTHTHTQTKEQRHTVARDQASQRGCTGVSPRVEGEKGLLVAPNPKPLDDQIAI